MRDSSQLDLTDVTKLPQATTVARATGSGIVEEMTWKLGK